MNSTLKHKRVKSYKQVESSLRDSGFSLDRHTSGIMDEKHVYCIKSMSGQSAYFCATQHKKTTYQMFLVKLYSNDKNAAIELPINAPTEQVKNFCVSLVYKFDQSGCEELAGMLTGSTHDSL